jgi:acyl transferase domain-containing protein
MLKTYNSRPASTGLRTCDTADDISTLYTGNLEIPQRTGKLLNLSKFDASFFGVHFKQAHFMDPTCRMLLEKTYEAVVDAGQQLLCPLVAGK